MVKEDYDNMGLGDLIEAKDRLLYRDCNAITGEAYKAIIAEINDRERRSIDSHFPRADGELSIGESSRGLPEKS